MLNNFPSPPPLSHTHPRRQIYKDRKWTSGCLGLDVGSRRTANGHEVSFPGDENVLKFDCGDGCTTLNLQSHCTLKMSKLNGM